MIFIAAIFVNNIVLSQFLGICPFLGVSKKISTALGMGFAVMFVMTISAIATHLIYYQLLVPNRLTFMITVVFILVIAALVQMVEIILHKTSPLLYQALGIFLPLITTNCAVLGVAILTIQKAFRRLLQPGQCHGLHAGNSLICRHQGKAERRADTQSASGRADCPDNRGPVVDGIYGLLRYQPLKQSPGFSGASSFTLVFSVLSTGSAPADE